MKTFDATSDQATSLELKQEAKAVSFPTENKKESTRKEASAFSFSAIYDFIGEVKGELERINWTSTEDLKTYVKVVIGVTFVFGLGIYCIDLVIQTLLHALRFVVHALIG